MCDDGNGVGVTLEAESERLQGNAFRRGEINVFKVTARVEIIAPERLRMGDRRVPQKPMDTAHALRSLHLSDSVSELAGCARRNSIEKKNASSTPSERFRIGDRRTVR